MSSPWLVQTTVCTLLLVHITTKYAIDSGVCDNIMSVILYAFQSTIQAYYFILPTAIYIHIKWFYK